MRSRGDDRRQSDDRVAAIEADRGGGEDAGPSFWEPSAPTWAQRWRSGRSEPVEHLGGGGSGRGCRAGRIPRARVPDRAGRSRFDLLDAETVEPGPEVGVGDRLGDGVEPGGQAE